MTIIAQPIDAKDYDWLKAAIASWLHRSGSAELTLRIPEFIMLAESEINTFMRMRLMEVDDSLTLLAGTRTIALPDLYLEPIRLDLVFTGRDNETLTYQAPNQMRIETQTGAAYQPQFWTVNGANIEFPAVADQDYSVLFRNLQGFDIATTSTNELLTKYPGVYLYGSLMHAAPWIANDARIATWGSMYDRIVKLANRKEARNKTLTTLQTELARGSRNNNIFRG
jgi:hypothetical protein